MPRDTAVKFCCWNKLKHSRLIHGPLARYVKLRVTHAPGMPGTFSPPPTSTRGGGENVPGIPGGCAIRNYTYLARGPCRERFPRHRRQRKPLFCDPGMHHGTCVTHVPWCMSESLTRGGGENVPGIPGGCAIRNYTYLARGPYNYNFLISLSPFPIIHQILRLIRIHYYEIKWPLTKTTKHKIPLIEVSIAFSYEYIFSYMCSSTKQSMHYG